MSHLPLVLALTLATGLAVGATMVQANVATPAKAIHTPAYSTCTPAALS